MRSKLLLGILLLVSVFTLAACGGDKEEANSHEGMDMNHSGSGEVPEGLKVEGNPAYKVGSQAILQTDHMDGMKGAKATIVGAFDTTAYSISYVPSPGGERVTNHKWVIQEEIEDAGEKTLEPGKKVTVDADHMEGMDGATVEIDSSEQTTVYMIDYTPTTGDEKVTNHKWVTESELSAE